MIKASLLLMLALAAAPVSAGDTARSLQSRDSLRAAVDQYVQAFMADQIASASASSNLNAILDGTAQAGDRSQLDELSKLIDASLDKHEQKDWSHEALQRELAKLGNGGRASDRTLAKLGVTSDRVAGAGQAIHSEIVSWLVARYYDRPEERDALYSLMSKFSDEIQPQVRARSRDIDSLIHYLSTGTSIGMTAVMVFDFRRHILDFGKAAASQGAEAWQGVRAWTRGGGPKKAAQTAVEWSKSTADSFRGGVMQSKPGSVLGLEIANDAKFAEELASERQALTKSQSALGSWESQTEKAVEELGREGNALAPANARAAAANQDETVFSRLRRLLRGGEEAAPGVARAAERDVPAVKPKHRRAAEYMSRLASQVARGFLIGGIPASIYALNEQSEAGKIDPLEVLKVFQLFALMEVEMRGADIASQARALSEELKMPGLTEAKRLAAREELKNLAAGYEVPEKTGDGMKNRHVAGLKDLRSQFEHLEAHATRFKGVVQYPDTMGEIAAYRNKCAALKLLHHRDERVAAFLSSSKELEDRIQNVDEKIRVEAAKRGFAPGAQLAASLAAADMELQSAEEALRALNELAKPGK